MEPNEVTLQDSKIEAFRAPQSAEASVQPGQVQIASVSSIVSVASVVFTFSEYGGTPGRYLQQSVPVSVPPEAGHFTCISYFDGAFTSVDFRRLTDRPLGMFHVFVGMRGDNLVCQVRLTDANSDDPIHIEVIGTVVFFN